MYPHLLLPLPSPFFLCQAKACEPALHLFTNWLCLCLCPSCNLLAIHSSRLVTLSPSSAFPPLDSSRSRSTLTMLALVFTFFSPNPGLTKSGHQSYLFTPLLHTVLRQIERVFLAYLEEAHKCGSRMSCGGNWQHPPSQHYSEKKKKNFKRTTWR